MRLWCALVLNPWTALLTELHVRTGLMPCSCIVKLAGVCLVSGEVCVCHRRWNTKVDWRFGRLLWNVYTFTGMEVIVFPTRWHLRRPASIKKKQILCKFVNWNVFSARNCTMNLWTNWKPSLVSLRPEEYIMTYQLYFIFSVKKKSCLNLSIGLLSSRPRVGLGCWRNTPKTSAEGGSSWIEALRPWR